MLDWQRPENRRVGYVPPLVAEGVLGAAVFWGMAAHNQRLRVREAADPTGAAAARVLLVHARRMRRAARRGT
jgi:hypothetical protein